MELARITTEVAASFFVDFSQQPKKVRFFTIPACWQKSMFQGFWPVGLRRNVIYTFARMAMRSRKCNCRGKQKSHNMWGTKKRHSHL
jgi:hypothetical protein